MRLHAFDMSLKRSSHSCLVSFFVDSICLDGIRVLIFDMLLLFFAGVRVVGRQGCRDRCECVRQWFVVRSVVV